jgi:hypothetical protein
VWQLLQAAYQRIGHPVLTCLERDFNIPELQTLTQEVEHIARLQQQVLGLPCLQSQVPASSSTRQVA